MWPFKRKTKSSPAAPPQDANGDQAPHTLEVVDQLRDRQLLPPQPARLTTSPLLKLLPMGKLIEGLVSIVRDPNGKLSSRRAGAGALIVAGIGFLAEGRHFEGVASLAFATIIFALVKWTGNDRP